MKSKKKLKILMLNYEFPPLGGGAGNATYYLLKEFSKNKNLEIDLVTSSAGKFRIGKFSPNITIHFLDIKKKGSLHYQTAKNLINYSINAKKYATDLAAKKNYDLTHAFFGIPCGYIAMKLKKKFGLPYIVSLRGSDVPFYNKRFYFLDRLAFKRISKKVWRNADEVIALSNDLVKLARKTSDQKISIIYNGVDTNEFFPSKRVNKKTINILFVGRLIERKGLIYLLNAFENLEKKYPSARLLIVGEGPLLNDYRVYSVKNNLNSKINFFGKIDHCDLARIYRKAHIFVLPSLNEALGNVTHEALASGLPIITTKTGASELMDGNGFVINKESSKEIEQSLVKLINDNFLRKKMSKKSREIALKMSWRECANKYIRSYYGLKIK